MSKTIKLTPEVMSGIGIVVYYTKTTFDNGITKVYGEVIDNKTRKSLGVVGGDTKLEVRRNIKTRFQR
jgi:hypothetical protein